MTDRRSADGLGVRNDWARSFKVGPKDLCAAVLTAVLLTAQSTQAVEFLVNDISISQGSIFGSHAFIPVGGTVSVGVRVADSAATPVAGVGASYYGWDPSLLSFVNGNTVPTIFHDQCPSGSGGTNGMANLVPSAPFEATAAVGGPFAGAARVRTIVAVSLTPKTANADDPGLDGICGGGDAQMRLTFEGIAEGETTLRIGTGDDLGGILFLSNGSIVQASNAVVTVSVPEPRAIGSLWAGLLLLEAMGTLRNFRARSAGMTH